MMHRRDYLLAVGATVGLAGCTAGSNRPDDSGRNATDTDSESTDEIETDPETTVTPTERVRQFYRALLAENTDALNAKIVHPASPTYPVAESHVPPEAFTQFEDVKIASVEEVSVQDMVVQRLGNPMQMKDWKEELGADDLQYVHTTFYVKKPGEEQAYEADTVDYAVEDDGIWYVRYDASKSTHGQQSDASRHPNSSQQSNTSQ
ncbi:hypothetical protein EGH24_01595 [Halonotius terrestris]|uniref:Uncharacterized protein n=1 Tax=Halonotius terrestris TaxID=2487750 RepID=A0A8J8PDR6_9EURY|nr:hypothetical protein [Halonotius terrestris]TQQ83511.1 hypothetical protein EGH24_01595 [Halonotius terrestris]